MIGAFPITSVSVSYDITPQSVWGIDPAAPIAEYIPPVIFPINSGPIAIFGLPTYLLPVDGNTVIYGRRRKLVIGKVKRIPKITVGCTISTQNRILRLNLPIGVQINRIPMKINSLVIRRLIIRSARGYNKTNMIPRNLDEMKNTNEAIWLLKLYELAVQELRTHTLPTEKAGALKISTPTLYAQALAMGEDVI